MKKWLTKIVAIVACFTVAACCFTACNKDDEGNENPLVGTYKLQYVEDTTGEVYPLGTEIPSFDGGTTFLTADTCVVKLKTNGQASLVFDGRGGNFAWEVNASDDTKVDFLMEGQVVMTISVVENVMAIEVGMVTYYLGKV